MHPITRREKLKKDLTDLNFFCKESDFSLEIIVYGKLASQFPDCCLFNRAERVMDGRGLTGCRSVAEAARQSSDTALPIGQVF